MFIAWDLLQVQNLTCYYFVHPTKRIGIENQSNVFNMPTISFMCAVEQSSFSSGSLSMNLLNGGKEQIVNIDLGLFASPKLTTLE